MNNTCCFTGHRALHEPKAAVYKKVYAAVKKLTDMGVSHYIVGGAAGFDMLCADVVLDIRKTNPAVHLHIAVPCRDQAKYYSPDDEAHYRDQLTEADTVSFLAERYFRGCMHIRNRFMVNRSQHIITYIRQNTGGSVYTKKYAEEKGLNIIEI